jgi:Ulp1 family protease
LLQYFLHRDLWKHIDEDKKSAYAYLDSLWFNMYYHGSNIPNVLKWIKSKRIFSRQYVFVPIVCLWVTLIITLCIHSINCQICIKFSAFFFMAVDTGASLSYATLMMQTARILRKDHGW